MTRINFANDFASTRNSIACGKTASALLFAALLIVCSIAVGCSSEKPQPVTVNQPPVTQNPAPLATTSSVGAGDSPAQPAAAAKPAPKKVVHRRPPTVTYADKTYGVSFDYPRKYGIETGDAANELVATSPLPMNFVQAGGTALAAVELPETSFPSTDFSSAFFNVSVNKTLSADQCEQFSVPQPKPSDQSASTSQSSKLMVGDMELHQAEAVAGEGPRQSDSKYFHIFQNGACYEFAMNVTTNASELEAGMKHVDRDKVFDRLAKILATVKINQVPAPEVTTSAPETQPATPAPAASEKPVTPAPVVPDTTASAPATPATSPATTTPAATETSPQ